MAAGRRVLRADTDISDVITNRFGYNARSELTDAIMATNSYAYRFDGIGNLTVATNNGIATTYAANELNQYTTVAPNPSNLAYDLDGNLVTNGGWVYTWDAENRLVGAEQGTNVLTFAYDYMSRRVAKEANGQTTHFLYDGWAMIRESGATATNDYVYGLDLSQSMQGAGTIGGLLWAQLDGAPVAYAYDAYGNVVGLVATNGSLAARYDFDGFGNTMGHSGPLASANPFRFSTKYTDDETGLVYFGFRYYSPQLGRWINRDPMGDVGLVSLPRAGRPRSQGLSDLLNLFRALGNSPIANRDPLGLQIDNNKCCRIKTPSDPCRDACADYLATDVNGTALGTTVCWGGQKCTCIFPERFQNGPPDQSVVQCVAQHEEAHAKDPALSCDGKDPCQAIPPSGPSGAGSTTECRAWFGTWECLGKISSGTPGREELQTKANGHKSACEAAGNWPPP